MKKHIVHESDIPEKSLPGRSFRWLANEESLDPKFMSVSLIRVPPGERVRPAHSHPNGEELIYIIRGTGRVLVGEEVDPVREGTAVLFPQGVPHMLHNTGDEELKVICFFAPATNLDNYKFFDDIDFPK